MKYHARRISYVPGKYLYLADTLSRAYIGDADGDYKEEVAAVHTVQVSEHREESYQLLLN